MKRILMLLAAATALSAAIGLPAKSSSRGSADGPRETRAALSGDVAQARPFVLASADDDDDRGHAPRVRRGDDDDHDEHDGRDRRDHRDDDDDDDGEHGRHRGNARNPAPAGTATPPANGLFGSGSAPKVKLN